LENTNTPLSAEKTLAVWGKVANLSRCNFH